MTYNEAIHYLYTAAPLFQNVGQHAYKPGLQTTRVLDAHFSHPHQAYATIHVAGTNGKGSVSHSLASILQQAGYRVGLYTSPHLLDFRERIRVNGRPISPRRVARFVEEERDFFEPLHPSFFELTTALAFLYFKEQHVDVAVVEVGLGGRIDCTNIITPRFAVITNIALDHTQLLGDTIAEIAGEKAGIIKPGVPVVFGENHPEATPVITAKAAQEGAPLVVADEADADSEAFRHYESLFELKGIYQRHNLLTLMAILPLLRRYFPRVREEDIAEGLARVVENTHLLGRWQTLSEHPHVICDTGHNPAAFRYLGPRLSEMATPSSPLSVVLGMVNDKDADGVLSQLPSSATYYFCQPSVKRARSAAELQAAALRYGLRGKAYRSVGSALRAALREQAACGGILFVGGSSYVVSDLLAYRRRHPEAFSPR